MRTEVHTGTTVDAFDGHFLFSQGYGANQAGFFAFSAAGTQILVEDHSAVLLLFQCMSWAGSGTWWILAAATDHDSKVAFDSSLGLDLDGAILERDGAHANSAAGEHASQAAYAALRMGHLQAAAHFGLMRCRFGSLIIGP
jgi:hypothetical protein